MSKQFYFVVGDYFGTGEGRTQSLLVTHAKPHIDRDYKVKPKYDLATREFTPGELLYPRTEIALMEFREHFGEWMGLGAEILSQENFLERYSHLLPGAVIAILTDPNAMVPGNYKWFSQLHANFS